MAETTEVATEYFTTNPELIIWAVIVIAIPFITGVILMAMRVFEIKKGDDYKISESFTGLFGSTGLALSWIASIILAFKYFGEYVSLEGHGHIEKVVGDTAFLPMKSSAFKWGLLLDPMSMIFLVALTTIATAIHFYASNYMHGDSAYTRFFGTLNFFTGSMLLFVLSSNMFTSFIAWELLGFSSYLLIGYFWPKRSASHAGRKAFMYNKIGDVSFIFAMGFTYARAHTFDYLTLQYMLQTHELTMADFALPGLFLFGAAVGKSAQVPLLGWLPEAMEGPTPVSALLHSSTMVKAGLYLIARSFFTFYYTEGTHVDWTASEISFLTNGSETMLAFMSTPNIIAWFGTLTALAGGLMALTATDIKKVLAFSTISQLGYIALAIGAGGVTAGFYHIISHATFKSLLFLGAGAVIHSVHSQEMSDMGGLRKQMPWTFRMMLVGTLGLMGVPLMNGFWSKDAVLLAMKESEVVVGNMFLYWVAVFTAGVTAFYSTKMLYLTFYGKARYDDSHVKPGPTSPRMKGALIFLGSLVIIESIWFTIGTLKNLFGEDHSLLNFEYALGTMLGVHGGEFAFVDALPSTTAVLLGFGFAYFIYAKDNKAILNSGFVQFFANIFENRFYLDKLIYYISNGPTMVIGSAFKTFDKKVIDELIIDNIVTDKIGFGSARTSDWMDVNVVDGTVKSIANSVSTVGGRLRLFQTGLVSNYAKYMMLGVVVILSFFVLENYNVINFLN